MLLRRVLATTDRELSGQKVFAFTDNREGAWQDPDFLRTYELAGTKIKVGENGSDTVQPKLIP